MRKKNYYSESLKLFWKNKLAVLSLLMGECHEKGFQSPIPAGTTLRSAEVKGSTAWVDFAGSYGQLSGMDLTIADYCVALSLTQLDGVYAVRITVNGLAAVPIRCVIPSTGRSWPIGTATCSWPATCC